MRDYLDIKFNSKAFLIEICVFFAPALVNKTTELLTDWKIRGYNNNETLFSWKIAISLFSKADNSASFAWLEAKNKANHLCVKNREKTVK